MVGRSAHGQWSQYEALLSSTWRELKAVAMVLDSFAPKLAMQSKMDNQNVVLVVEAGSKKQHLQVIALSIFETCLRQSIRLDMEWISRSLDDKADYISRILGLDNWSINPQFFSWIDSMWGPHSVDCFCMLTTLSCQNFTVGFGALALLAM